MPDRITLIGAPSNIGIRPYDDGTPRGLDRAPAVLRRLGLATRLGAEDAGDIAPPPYRDFERPPGRARNESELVRYSRQLADAIAALIDRGRFPLLLGGDCSVVLGALLGARGPQQNPIGLAYVDGHADFATPSESRTGSAASMCLAMAVGRGDTPLAHLAGSDPLVKGRDTAMIGRRDVAEAWYGHDQLERFEMLVTTASALRRDGPGQTAAMVLDRLARPELSGFWIHLDADVLDASVMPAVDSPEPEGPSVDELAQLLSPMVQHPRALGLELTIYDPVLDPGLECGERLVALLERVLVHP